MHPCCSWIWLSGNFDTDGAAVSAIGEGKYAIGAMVRNNSFLDTELSNAHRIPKFTYSYHNCNNIISTGQKLVNLLPGRKTTISALNWMVK